jgi:Scaffold domain
VVASSSRRVLALFAAASISFPLSCAPSGAEERDELAAPVGRADAVHSAIRTRLSEKSSTTGRESRAIVDYYAGPEARLLWVDENGLSPRAKGVMEEIAKADEYGLRSSTTSFLSLTHLTRPIPRPSIGLPMPRSN